MDGLIPPWTPSTSGYSVFAVISNPYVYVMSFNGKNLVTQAEPIEITEFAPARSQGSASART